jgi:hypothetical protein
MPGAVGGIPSELLRKQFGSNIHVSADAATRMPDTQAPGKLEVGNDDYPALFLAADRASLAAQRRHLFLTSTILLSLILAAGFSASSDIFPAVKTPFAVASTSLVALAFVLTSIRRSLKPEKLWYGGRAVAESAKSMAWRYMTGAEPYALAPSTPDTDLKFIADLKSLVRGDVAVGVSSEFADRPQISPRMRQLRSSSLAERKETYLGQRISDQRRWYGNKARKSQTAEGRYFVVILVAQALALGASAYLITSPETKWKLVGFFSAVANALVAWLQIRQHQELAQSYAVAALELGFIEEQAQRINTDQNFSAFVGDAENAISREHTLWIARRDRN